jgi:chain length determinant protein tyrosine kinase EpsG
MKVSYQPSSTPSATAQPATVVDPTRPRVVDRSIGDLIREARRLSDVQIEQILIYQREHGVRFGEAAVALNLADHDDVVWALSQQFHYPYAPTGRKLGAELVVAGAPFSDEAEAFRELRSQLLMGVLGPDEQRRALAVLSPDVGDGKSYLAANLAVAFSHLGGRTLLVDADLRTPRQHEIFELGNDRPGLSGILSGRSETNVIQQAADLPSLYLLPAGTVPPNPLELLQRPAFGLLMHELLSKFDHVVVDTPAATHGSDSRVVATKCGAALVVGRRGTSRMQAMASLTNALSRGPVKLAGIVMNEY